MPAETVGTATDEKTAEENQKVVECQLDEIIKLIKETNAELRALRGEQDGQ